MEFVGERVRARISISAAGWKEQRDYSPCPNSKKKGRVGAGGCLRVGSGRSATRLLKEPTAWLPYLALARDIPGAAKQRGKPRRGFLRIIQRVASFIHATARPR